MLRWLLVLLGAAAICAVDVQPLLAQAPTGWPPLGAPFSRGNGAYLSPWKILAVWLVFLCWVRSTDWVSTDGQHLKLRWALWNAIVFSSFFAGLLLLWILPWFLVGIVLLIVAYAAPLGSYIYYRNKQVTSPYDKIFSRKHMRRWLAKRVNRIGIKMEGADVDPRELGPDIKFKAMGGVDDSANSIAQIKARQSEGYLPARQLLDDALSQRGTDIILDFTAESAGVRYLVDGVWLDRAPLDRQTGDLVLTVFKTLAALKVEDRRSRQSGTFGVEVGKDKSTCRITSQGTKTGERVLLQFEKAKSEFKTLDDLGMRPKTQEQIEALFANPGLVIFSALPGGGLTTTLDVLLSNIDRFTRNFVTVVEETKAEREIENVHATTYSTAEGQTPAAVLPKLIRTYPDVIIVRDVADLETLSILCEQVGENRLTVTSVRAKLATEALLRMMMLKIPPQDFAAAVTGVVNVRLIRRLCDKCKEGYPPPAEVLKQLGLPAGRIEALYRPPTAPIDPKHPEVVCDQCQGIGYFGRTAVFEVLVVDDAIREVLTTAPRMENLAAAVRKGKQRSLQEEGVLLVARGVTSIQELLRVLKL